MNSCTGIHLDQPQRRLAYISAGIQDRFNPAVKDQPDIIRSILPNGFK